MLEIVWCPLCFAHFEEEQQKAALIFEKILMDFLRNDCKPVSLDYNENHCENCRLWINNIRYLELKGYLLTTEAGSEKILLMPSNYYKEHESKGYICSGTCSK